MLTELTLRMMTALAPAPEGAPGAGGNWIIMLLFYGGLFGIFYFLLIRPQTKKTKEIESMQSKLTKGDSIVTSGGIYGTVFKVKDDIVTLQVAENTKIKIQRAAISERLKESEARKLDG